MAEIVKPSGLSKTWAKLGDKIEPSDVKKDTGWVEEIPTYQDFNWIQNRTDTAVAHINQMGVPVWDSGTEYQAGKSYVTGSDGNIYTCKVTNTNNNPVSDVTETNWVLFLQQAKKSKPAVTLSLSNSWANVGTAISAEVISGVLYVNGNLTGGTTTADTTVATLPAYYRPAVTKFATGIFQTGVYTYDSCSIEIQTGGAIKIRGVTSSTNLYINLAVTL